ncbi:MAG: carbohydrate-binding protein, partial [Chloroflexota bacterium]|nr:carbohydrate-binding protein [Chloroflexota bacterium]
SGATSTPTPPPNPTPTPTPTPTPPPSGGTWRRIEAESHTSAAAGIAIYGTSDPQGGTQDVGNFNNGRWIAFSNQDLGGGVLRFRLRGNGPTNVSGSGTINLHIGSPTGPLLCTLTWPFVITYTTSNAVNCTGTAIGVQTLYLVNNNVPWVNVNWFEIEVSGSVSCPASEICPEVIIRDLETAYRIDVLNESLWIENENSVVALQNAITNTAQALRNFALTYNTSETRTAPQIFNAVLAGGQSRIEFDLVSSSSNCITNQETANPVTARVTCHLTATQFTFVHELGHVFIKRTGQQLTGTSSFWGLVEYPVPASSPRRLRVAGVNIFGEFSYFLTPPPPAPTPTPFVVMSDWMRGNNGWGSGSDILPNPGWSEAVPPISGGQIAPPAAVWIGPCRDATGSNGIPTTFQQNPCHLRNYVIYNLASYNPLPAPILPLSQVERDKLAPTEIEEAAADMFLNWVARSTNMADTNGVTGFANRSWIDRTNYSEDPFTGDARNDWMNCAMIALFNQHSGFWGSGTNPVPLPSSCIANYPGLPSP